MERHNECYLELSHHNEPVYEEKKVRDFLNRINAPELQAAKQLVRANEQMMGIFQSAAILLCSALHQLNKAHGTLLLLTRIKITKEEAMVEDAVEEVDMEEVVAKLVNVMRRVEAMDVPLMGVAAGGEVVMTLVIIPMSNGLLSPKNKRIVSLKPGGQSIISG